jgi:hypothetical protein
MENRILTETYLLSMGEYLHKDHSELQEKRALANRLFNDNDGLKAICMMFYQKIKEMGEVEDK